ncbi:MAG: carboxypeptidase regulatory-like domain-containing protein [Chlorobia bacterium]|nr:carboxypeptidase regulatory-like domain-containing protein [Fimbriimonadaceae bacterium]
MRILRWISYSAAVLALAGCGGGGGGAGSGPRTAEVSGIVTDFNGDVVRGARVWINEFGETDTNSAGTYILDHIAEGDWKIRSEIEKDGIVYKGENVARVFEGERSKSVNVTLIRENQQARVFGTVIDNQGFAVQGARVFAIATNDGGVYSSTYEITDSNGRFDLDSLVGGVDYKINASAVGYNSDVDVVNVSAGNDEELILTLKNATDPLLPAPTGLVGVAWTSPSEATRSAQARSAVDNIKRLFDPRTPKRTVTRDTVNGNWIETDLFWDAYPDNDSHIGYGIYRRLGTSGQYTAIDFLRDPEAEIYADADQDLQELESWGYLITALNTNYPDTGNSESDPSNAITVETLGDLFTNSVLQGPLRFRWDSGSGADEFVVYLFDEYPGVGVDSIWNNSASPATGTQLTYTGPSLQNGQRYYYVVLGLANGQGSRTISRVDEFIAN